MRVAVRWGIAATLAVAVPVLGAYWRTIAPVDVTTMTVGPDTIRLTVASVVPLESALATDVGSRVSGTLRSIYVREGEHVTRGQLLALVDPDEGVVGRDLARIATTDASRQEAAALLALAQRERERQRLRDIDTQVRAVGPLVAAETHEQAALAVGQAEAALSAARSRREATNLEVAQARRSAERWALRAPHDGVVFRIYRRVGETVVPAAFGGDVGRVVTVAVMTDGLARVPVDDRAALLMDSTARVSAVIVADPSRPLRARVRRVGPILRGNRPDGFEIEVDVAVERGGVPVGAMVAINVTVAETHAKVGVPLEAVVSAPDGGIGVGVYAVEDGRAVFRRLKLGVVGDATVAVQSGLSAGMQVILPQRDLQEPLRTGMPVRVRR
jgi:RND family efflux transporter MFP subunit